jgi:iodothyronine deiodinase-like protein
MKSNVDQNVCYAQPHTTEQRVAIANDFIQRFHFPVPFSVDDMHDIADHEYSAWPERIYIIDEQGKIVYRGGIGPFNYHPAEARAWLEKRFPVTPRPTTSALNLKPPRWISAGVVLWNRGAQ